MKPGAIHPELSASSKAKHDARSDVSFLAGILFYLLTGQAPRILVDSQGRQPQERGNELFTIATRADARFNVGIVGLFQANFSIELSKRHASMRDFNRAIAQLRDPGAVKSTRRMEQEAEYLALMNSAAQRQEDSLNAAMKRACDAFVGELRAELSRLRSSLIEISLAGGARRSGSGFSNHVRVSDTSSGIDVEGEIVATREAGLVKGVARIADTGWYEFYSGPAGDLVGLRKAFVDQVKDFVGHALQEHVRLTLSRRSL